MNIDAFLEWAHIGLLESDRACEYLQGRGISKFQMASHRLGYVSDDYSVDSSIDPNHGELCSDRDKKHLWCDSCHFTSWSSSWEAEEEGGKKMQFSGRRIKDSVVFPLTSYSGTHIGFQIRHLERKEYDTFVIHRRPEGFFFCNQINITSIWSTQTAVMVEGPGDHLVYERLVDNNVVALTTSGVSKFQLRFLRRFAKRIVTVLDMDDAGRKGVKSFNDQYGNEFEIVNLKYPVLQKEKDIGDLWKRLGDDKFRSYFKRALSGA